MHDNYSAYKNQRCIEPKAVGTTGAANGSLGKIVDRRGYVGPVLFDIGVGAITATGATVNVIVYEGDTTGAMTSAADADLIGTEAAAGVAAAVRVSGTTNRVAKKIAYKGGKRYANVRVYSTVSAAVLVAVTAIQRAASQPAA